MLSWASSKLQMINTAKHMEQHVWHKLDMTDSYLAQNFTLKGALFKFAGVIDAAGKKHLDKRG